VLGIVKEGTVRVLRARSTAARAAAEIPAFRPSVAALRSAHGHPWSKALLLSDIESWNVGALPSIAAAFGGELSVIAVGDRGVASDLELVSPAAGLGLAGRHL
jgi:hypothetical protein